MHVFIKNRVHELDAVFESFYIVMILSYKMTIPVNSQGYKNWYILLMSSRKRMTLNKTWLPNHRKLYSRDLLVCKSKNQVLQIYTDTKRTNSKSIHTKTKNTDEVLHILHEDTSLRACRASEGQKELNTLFKNSSKGQLGQILRYLRVWELTIRELCFASYWLPLDAPECT